MCRFAVSLGSLQAVLGCILRVRTLTISHEHHSHSTPRTKVKLNNIVEIQKHILACRWWWKFVLRSYFYKCWSLVVVKYYGRSPLLTSSRNSAYFRLPQDNKVFRIKKSSSSKFFYIHDCLRSWVIDSFWSDADWWRNVDEIVILVVDHRLQKKKVAPKKQKLEMLYFQSSMGVPLGELKNDGMTKLN